MTDLYMVLFVLLMVSPFIILVALDHYMRINPATCSSYELDRLDRQMLADLRRREAAGIEPPVKCRVINMGGAKRHEDETENETDERMVEL